MYCVRNTIYFGFYKDFCLITLSGATSHVIKRKSEFQVTFSIQLITLLIAFHTYHLSRIKGSSMLSSFKKKLPMTLFLFIAFLCLITLFYEF